MKNSSGITLKNITARRAAALLTAILMFLAVGCSARPETASSENSPGGASSETRAGAEIDENRKKGIVPLFSNEFDYSRGGEFPENGEDYLNYSAYKAQFFTYKDMDDNASAVSSARLAQMGVFEQTDNFNPQGSITVLDCIKKIFIAAEMETDGKSDDDIIALAKSSGLAEEGVFTDFSKDITLPELSYLADRATPDREDTEQFAMYFSDYENVPEPLKKGVLQAFGLGIIESEGTLSPDKPASRAQAADVIYRLVNPGARVVTPYELGTVYNETDSEFLVRNTYATNPGGVQLGIFSNYNHQDTTFKYFGKRTADRTDFYKWSAIEKTKGKYTMPNFSNDFAAHRAGNTAIINIDLSANYNVAPSLSDGSRIPSFYTQDITDKTTRTAAKQFLYQFVSSMMTSLYGDVMLAIDYELDFQQGLNGTTEQHRRKAEIFADWYAEACTVAREAARSVGAADRLKLICIYNNITDLHKLGKAQNEWMLKIAEASDYIGIDSYQRDSNDVSNPNLTIQNLRFLANNYSLGKPVIMVENGITADLEDKTKDSQGRTVLEQQRDYFINLFRELAFSLERGGFLNRNISGYLIWSMRDTASDYGLVSEDGSIEKPALKAVQEGFWRLERQRQFNPSVRTEVSNAKNGTQISVEGGTAYQSLTYVVKNRTGGSSGSMRIKLKEKGSAMITVNGRYHYSSLISGDMHVFEITEGLKEGFNRIEIFFGADQTPFEQTVEKILIN